MAIAGHPKLSSQTLAVMCSCACSAIFGAFIPSLAQWQAGCVPGTRMPNSRKIAYDMNAFMSRGVCDGVSE